MYKLIKPNLQLENEFRIFIEDFHTSSELIFPWVIKLDSTDFKSYISRLEDFSQGNGMKQGYSPNSTFWMVNKKNEIIGAVNIRHRLSEKDKIDGGHIGYGISPRFRRQGLGKQMLKLSIEKARELGVSDILLTCDKNNIGSKRVIEQCGGQLENEVVVEDEIVSRYWIK